MAHMGTLSEFNPRSSDWTIFQKRLEQFFIVNKIATNEMKRAILLNSLNEEAFKLMQDLCVPADPETKTFEELTTCFTSHFKPKKAIFVERYNFYKAKMNADESLADWAARVRNLAIHCEFGIYLEIALRDKFIMGLNPGKILTRLLSEGNALSLQKAVELAQATEAASTSYGIDHQRAEEEEVFKMAEWRKRESASGAKTCAVCGKSGHEKAKCYFRNNKCHNCGKQGHLKSVCKSVNKNSGKNFKNQTKKVRPYNYLSELPLHKLNGNKEYFDPYMINVKVNNIDLKMELDSGSGVSVIPSELWENKFKKIKLNKSDLILKSFFGEKRQPLGNSELMVEYQNKSNILKFEIIKGGGPPLLGRNFMEIFQVNFQDLKKLQAEPDIGKIFSEFPNVFTEGLGTFKGLKVKLPLKEGTTGKFMKQYTVPFAIKEKVEAEIDRLVKSDIIYPVKSSEWATPIVPVPKPDGSVRLCGNYKITLNPSLIVEQYPLPRIEELFAELRDGEEFSKLDLSRAYLQLVLDKDSQKLTTINTHKGLFAFKRLPYGIASAPSIFQRNIEQLFKGIPGVIVFIDDILITGKNKPEHIRNLTKVLKILESTGLKIRRDKCEFFKKSIEYLGHVIDKNGLHKTQKKIDAILNAQAPTDKQKLQSFIGSVTYYHKFIKNVADILQPLYKLLKKDVTFKWDENCQNSFEKIKKEMSSNNFLAYYDPNLQLNLYTDASPYGLGATLTHKYADGTEKPICYCSRTLNQAEQKYSQIDREALGIYYGVKKLHQYLFGRKFTLFTDNKPLMAIFGDKKGIPAYAANRLQRYAVFLNNYTFDIQYITSKKNPADWLSRSPIENGENLEENISYINLILDKNRVKLSLDSLKSEIEKDTLYQGVLNFVKNGWPYSMSKDDIYRKFFDRKLEISEENGILLLGLRVIIPQAMRELILKEIHSSHMGIVKMKNMAREHVWWPGIDKCIENLAQSCESCLKVKDSPPKSILIPWEITERPFDRIHADFFGPIFGNYFLVIIDSYSKWIEVFFMKNITTKLTISKFRQIFSRYGLPKILVTDNGTQFTAKEFKMFLENNGVKHLTGAPYNPQTNGAAENAVKTVKSFIKKEIGSNRAGGEIEDKVNVFLMQYRNCIHCSTGETPAKLFLGRNLRTRLDLIKPDSLQKNKYCKINKNKNKIVNNMKKAQNNQKINFKGKRKFKFNVGDICQAKFYKNNHCYFTTAKIIKILGKLHYLVKIQNKIVKRHLNQLRRCSIHLKENNGLSQNNDFSLDNYDHIQVTDNHVQGEHKRSKRPRFSERYPRRAHNQPNWFRSQFS